MSMPGSTWPARSGWPPSTPVSTTATTVPAPFVVAQAASVSRKPRLVLVLVGGPRDRRSRRRAAPDRPPPPGSPGGPAVRRRTGPGRLRSAARCVVKVGAAFGFSRVVAARWSPSPAPRAGASASTCCDDAHRQRRCGAQSGGFVTRARESAGGRRAARSGAACSRQAVTPAVNSRPPRARTRREAKRS